MWPDSYTVFDFETTGLCDYNDRIVQVGVCHVEDRKMVRADGWIVKQDMEVPVVASDIHKITTARMRAEGICPKQSIHKLSGILSGSPAIIGHNIHRFDCLFLENECNRYEAPLPEIANAIDTAALYKGLKLGIRKSPDESHRDYADRVLSIKAYGLKYKVSICLEELGIAFDGELHDATRDTVATHLIFEGMRNGGHL